MGVSGSGKSTLARLLAKQYQLCYLDADDFHSSKAVEMMRAGNPLNDQIREAWIGRLNRRLVELAAHGESCVLAFSGLKQMYREMIWDMGFQKYAFLLDVDKAQLCERLTQRKAHFFNASLLDSQLATLEMPAQDEAVILLPQLGHPDELIGVIEQHIFVSHLSD